MVDFATNFTENIKGHTFERVDNSPDVLGYTVFLSGNRPETLKTSSDSLTSFSGTGAAAHVGENQAKPSTTASWTKSPISVAKLVTQVRVSDEVLKYETEANLDVLADLFYGAQKSAARGIDTVVTHGTNPVSGESVNGSDGAAVLNWITNNSQNEVVEDDSAEALSAAIERALGSINSDANGIVLTRDARTLLAGHRNQFGVRTHEELSFRGKVSSLYGMTAVIDDNIGNTADVASGASGEDTDIVAIVADWSKLRFGITRNDFEPLHHGSPDGGPDLNSVNQVLFRSENWIKFGSEDDSAFVTIRLANSGEEGN